MSEPPQRPPQQPPPAAVAGRFIAGVFGLAFGGIGLTVIIALWSGGMGDAPTFFKIVGSFIAIVFVAMGVAMVYGAITGGGLMAQQQSANDAATGTTSSTGAPAGYTCPHCGAGLARDAEVSPMGDVKCSFCGRWFNVHGRN
jgi:hypothetical protein